MTTQADQQREAAEQARQEQIAIQAAFLAQFVATWELLDWSRIDATTLVWMRAAMSAVRAWRQRSAESAIRHYAIYRHLSVPRSATRAPSIHFTGGQAAVPDLSRLRKAANAPGRPLGSETARFTKAIDRAAAAGGRDNSHDGGLGLGSINLKHRDDDHVEINWDEFDRIVEHALLVTGPGELKRQSRLGRTEQQARDRALVVVSGSASRQVLNGGRAAVLTSISADDEALGYARLTDGDPCAFCSLLAARGPVYKSEASAGFQPHDACACIPIPVFSKRDPRLGRSREFQRLYEREVQGQYSGAAARNAYRRAYEAQRKAAAQPAEVPSIA